MRLTVWSVAYLLPLIAYGWVALMRRQTLLNPLAVGGCYLLVMFLLESPYGQSLPVGYMLTLHFACATAYWLGGGLGFRLAGWAEQGNRRQPVVMRKYTWAGCMLAAVGIAAFIFIVSYDNSMSVLLEMRNRTNLRLGSISMQVGNLERVALYLRGYVAPMGTLGVLFWCLRVQTKLFSLTLLATTLAAWGLVALGGGSRGAIVFLLVECTFAVYYARRSRGKLRLAPRAIIAVLVPLAAIAVLTQTLYRNTGVPMGHALAELQSRTSEASMTFLEHLSFNDEVNFVLSTYPDFYPYTLGHSLYTPFTALVPRSWWANKPVPWGRDLAWQYGFGYFTTVSLAATVPGEGYANFGVAGWVLFPLAFGFAIGWCQRRLRRARDDFDIVVGLGGLFLALSLRGDVHSAMVSIILPYVLTAFALRWIGFRRSQATSREAPSRSPAFVQPPQAARA